VYCGQTVGLIKIKLGMEVGLVPGHIVLDGDPAPPQGGTAAPHFSAHVYCGQTAGGSRCHLVQVGRKIGLGPGHIVLDGNPCSSPKEKRGTPPFSAHVYGQTDRWIKIPLGTKKASARGHIVLNWVIYTVSQKTSHLWFAITLTHMSTFWYFLAETLSIK